jgi:hypothetical protein
VFCGRVILKNQRVVIVRLLKATSANEFGCTEHTVKPTLPSLNLLSVTVLKGCPFTERDKVLSFASMWM